MPRIRSKLSRASVERKRVQVTMTIGSDVLKKIDAISRREKRSRSQVMEFAATQFAEGRDKAHA